MLQRGQSADNEENMRSYKANTVHPVQKMWQEYLGKIISLVNEYTKWRESTFTSPYV